LRAPVPAGSAAPSASAASRPGALRSLEARLAALTRPLNRRDAALIVLGALGVGALTLLLPSTPTYDPWSWVGWGREILHLDLNTLGGPSWKPGPVLFTTVFSIFGPAAPDLWLMVARGGGFLALFMIFRFAVRLTDRRTGLLAGAIAVFTICATGNFVKDIALGNSEGMLIAFILLAFERHVDGRPRQAFVLGFLGALLRPETWFFLLVYGLWLLWRDHGAWKLVLGLFALLPALWFGPELWGSGNLFRAASRASDPNPNSPAYSAHPALTVLQNARPVVFTPGKIGTALAILVGLVETVRTRRLAPALFVALAAGAWLVTVAGLTEAHFSGNPRYLLPASGLLSIVGGVGWGWLVARAAWLAARVGRPEGATAATLIALALVAGVFAVPTYRRLQLLHKIEVALHYQAIVRDRYVAVVDRMGGREPVLACGKPYAGKFLVAMVAWYLDTPGINVAFDPAAPGAPPGVVFSVKTTRREDPVPIPPPSYRPVADSGPWHVFAHCAPGRSLRAAP